MDNRTAVVGVDPGGRTTGVCVRLGDEVAAAELVRRDSDAGVVDATYLAEVVSCVSDAITTAKKHTEHVVVAVEGLNPPTPHLGMASVSGLLGAATVLGALLSQWPDAVVIPPGGHGSSPLQTYPEVLRGPKEVSGTGKRRHVRSAWDVAGAHLDAA